MGIAIAIEESVDTLVTDFVTRYSTALCTALIPIAVTAITIYIIWTGWLVARGGTGDSWNTALMRIVRVAFVVTLSLSAGNYQDLVLGTINGIGGLFLEVFTTATTIGALLDGNLDPFTTLCREVANRAITGVFPNFVLLLAAVLIALSAIAMLVVGLGMIMLAKVALALLFAIGPAFLLCAMFPVTQRFTESWLAQALQFVFVNVLVVVLVAMLSDFSASYVASIAADSEAVNVLLASLSLTIAVGAALVVFLNINTISSALTGGLTIGGVGRDVARMLTHGMSGGRSSTARAGGELRQLSNPSSAPQLTHSASTPAYQRAINYGKSRENA